MFKGVYDPQIVSLVPLMVMGAGIVLAIALGPWLIKRTCKKAGLPTPSWISRAANCGVTSLIVMVGGGAVWMMSMGALLGLFGDKVDNSYVPFIVAIIWGVVFIFVAAHLCGVPVVPTEVRLLSRRKRVYSVGVMLLLVGVLFSFVAFNSLRRKRFFALEARDFGDMRGLVLHLKEYNKQFSRYPEHLGQLGDLENFCDHWFPESRNCEANNRYRVLQQTRPYPGPPWLSYVRLPDDAPGDLLWVWPDPKDYEGERFHVLYRSGKVGLMYPDQLPAELEKLRRWQAAHPQKSAVKGKKAAASQPAKLP